MGFAVYEDRWHPGRWAGYAVPAECDVPNCETRINRGMGYQCEDREVWDSHQEEYLMDSGCHLYFCEKHRYSYESHEGIEPKPDLPEWLWWILASPSWEQWRDENPVIVMEYNLRLEASGWRPGKKEFEELEAETWS